MPVQNCPQCGGTHFGQNNCPFTSAACVVCGDATVMACSDCAIDTGQSVHVCGNRSCRLAHEASHEATSPELAKDNT